MAACDRDRLLDDIRSGKRLRPTKTLDKSKPILLAEGERLKTVIPLVDEKIQNGCPPIPPPPPPPPLPQNLNSSTLPRGKSNHNHQQEDTKNSTPDRDALMQAIRQGVSLRKVKNALEKKDDHEHFTASEAKSGLLQRQNSRSTSSISAASTLSDDSGPVRKTDFKNHIQNGIQDSINRSVIDRFERQRSVSKSALENGNTDAVDECTVRKWAPVETEKRVRPQKLPLNHATKCEPVENPAQNGNTKNSDVVIMDQKNGDFTLNGFVNGAKAIWEKRTSVDDGSPQQQPTVTQTKIPSSPAIRFFNGPDYPDSINPCVSTPAPTTVPIQPPQPPVAASKSQPITVDTNFTPKNHTIDRQKSIDQHPRDDANLPKVDDLRRAYENFDHKPDQSANNTLRKQKQPKSHAPPLISSNRHRSESLDADFRTDPPSQTPTPAPIQTKQLKQATRFLPDVGALKQRFEEKAIEERNRLIRTPTVVANQQIVSTSNASSGYSSGSPSPKGAEHGKQTGRFQFQQTTATNGEHKRRRSGNLENKCTTNGSKGSYVANNPNSETVGPFKANISTLGCEEGYVKKNRNYYRHDPNNTVSMMKQSQSMASIPSEVSNQHQNGNANETATWIVKKGSVPNVVTKYGICDHLEALHQRKFLNPQSMNGDHASSATNSERNNTKFNDDHNMDGEVARLLGIPFEKLKDLRFDIDVNDPEGSLLRIQKRYNEVS